MAVFSGGSKLANLVLVSFPIIVTCHTIVDHTSPKTKQQASILYWLETVYFVKMILGQFCNPTNFESLKTPIGSVYKLMITSHSFKNLVIYQLTWHCQTRWWARRGGYNDGTQCWLDDGHVVEVTMMAHNAGWMMGTLSRLQWWHHNAGRMMGMPWRLQWWHTMLAGWWARRGGYNDDTQCWLDDGHGVEVTMMAHNAGRMMGMPWRLQWWHTMLAGWWARRGGYNDDTQCWLDDGHGVEVTMMAHNAGWMMGMAWRLQWWHNAGRMMGKAWRLQWWHTMLAGWWAWRWGYNDGTQYWLDDGQGVEVTMMAHNAGWVIGTVWRLQWWHNAGRMMGTSWRLQWWHTMLAGWWARRRGYNDGTQRWQDDGHAVEVTVMAHNAGRMMGTSWRLQWWHTMLAGWWARRRGYNDDTQCWLDDGHGVEVTMMAHNAGWMMGMAWRLQWWHNAGRMMGMAWRLQWWHNAGRMMGKAWRLQWWHTMLTHHLQARCKPHYKNTWPTIYKPSVNHTTKIIDPPSTSQV